VIVNFIIVALVVLAGSIALGLLALEDPGYILISRPPFEIEVSLSLFVLLCLLLFTGAYFAIRFLLRTWRAPRDLARWRAGRRVAQARRATLSGYAGLIEGNWEAAQAELLRFIDHNETPLLSYLGAAYAAQRRGDLETRDEFLRRADTIDPEHQIAVTLTRARLQYQAGQLDEARRSLEPLALAGPRNRQAQRILAEILRQREDWQSLARLLPLTRRGGALSDAERDSLEQEALARSLPNAAEGGQALTESWNRIPKRWRRDPAVIAAYASHLIEGGLMNEAEAILRDAVRRQWDGRLVRLYGDVKSDRIEDQIAQAERWQDQRPGDVDALLTLGRLLRRNGDRQRAREYLVEAVESGGDRRAYMILGRLLEELGEKDNAVACYREGLSRQSPDGGSGAPGPLLLPRTDSLPGASV
jgi:HemY protein